MSESIRSFPAPGGLMGQKGGKPMSTLARCLRALASFAALPFIGPARWDSKDNLYNGEVDAGMRLHALARFWRPQRREGDD